SSWCSRARRTCGSEGTGRGGRPRARTSGCPACGWCPRARGVCGWPATGRVARAATSGLTATGGRRSDSPVGEELGVVALALLGLGDLVGGVELVEVDDLHVVAGALEGVLVDEGPRGVDAHGA